MTGSTKRLVCKYVGLGMRSHFAAKLAGVSENEVAMALEDEALVMRDIENEYLSREKPRVGEQIAEWLAEIPEQEKRNIRLKLLRERIQIARDNKDVSDLRSLVAQFHFLMGVSAGLEPADIEQARTHKIESIIKTIRGMALCPFHNEKSPSMDIRKNFYYCYGCGAHGDVISLTMHLENLNFAQAVKRLV